MASTAAAAVAAKAWWTAAMSVGTVEGLKDQSGLCRWNYALRSLHHSARDSLLQQNGGGRGPAAAAMRSKPRRPAAAERPEEEAMRTVMYLSCCWGPS